MRVNIAGGTPIQVNDVETQDFAAGASWADNGMIYFGQDDGVWQVTATGGTPVRVVETEDGRVWGPQLLPGGEWILFTLRGADPNSGRIVAQSLVTENRVELVPRGTDARWLSTGHLVYALDGTLLAVPFDPSVMEPPAGAVSMAAGIRMSTAAAANYGVAQNGMLVLVPGTGPAFGYQLAWVDRNGPVEPLPFAPDDSRDLDLSWDGQRIAVAIGGDEGSDIWIYETERGGSRVLLTTGGNNRNPVWSPDGQWVFFRSERGGNDDIWKRRADKSSAAELVLDIEARVGPTAISADGEMLLFDRGSGPSNDVGILALGTDPEPRILIESSADEEAGDFSPDGRFFAFMSNETGQYEVYVMDVAGGGTFPVSTSTRGGAVPFWSRDGKEIYYVAPNNSGILVAGVDTERLSASEPVEVSDISRRRFSNFAVTEDGQRFLVIIRPVDVGDAEGTADYTPRIRVILNWSEELKRQVPTGR